MTTPPATKHFRFGEFRSPSRTGSKVDVPRNLWPNLKRLQAALEVVRTACGDRPITIVSGYRTPEYNRAVGGARRSQHMAAQAADIRIAGMSPRDVFRIVDQLQRRDDDACAPRIPPGGAHAYGTFVHMDIRGHFARW